MPRTTMAFLAGLAAIVAASVAGPSYAQVSQDARRACERKAAEVRPMLNAPELEAFIANCLADVASKSGSSSEKKSGY
jgi:hypothetical protein